MVPIIDVAPWRLGSEDERTSVARDVDRALRSVGFMQIVGHGVPDDVIAAMRRETDRFFTLPLNEKLAVKPPRPGLNRGYAALGSEALAYSLGLDTRAPDLFEAFNIGPEEVPDDPWHEQAPHDFFAPNLWPAALPELRPALTAYFAAAASVGSMLTDVFARALGLPDRWFRPYVDRSTLTLRVNHYERRRGDPPPLPDQMRMGAHTDYGIVTVLYADPVPGLQILGPEGRFHDVTPEPGALLVNIGDMTAEWTNDRWRSTIHRVVPPPEDSSGEARRRSVALFLDGNYDAVIECLPTCTGPGNPPRYAPVVAGQHLIDKLLGPRTLSPSSATNTAGDRLSSAGHALDARTMGSPKS